MGKPETIDSVEVVLVIGQKKEPEPEAYLFDDVPLEQILYGDRDESRPTKANLFFPALSQFHAVEQVYRDGQIQLAVNKAAELAETGYPFSLRMCYCVAAILSDLIPHYPNPVLHYDLTGLGPLLVKLWDTVMKSDQIALQERIGQMFYRWHEHYGQYGEARQILTVMLDISRKTKNRTDEANFLNNYAFEFYLEGRYAEALPIFEQAAKLFDDCRDVVNTANARANVLSCLIELGNFECIEQTENELAIITQVLEKSTFWHQRKPFILRARIEECRGNIDRAIELVQEAIKRTDNKKTWYPVIDRQYLRRLKRKWGKRSRGFGTLSDRDGNGKEKRT
jgi:tetratricopeptide (TPR) repeat protein